MGSQIDPTEELVDLERPIDLSEVDEPQFLFYLARRVPLSGSQLAAECEHRRVNLREVLSQQFGTEISIDQTGFIRLNDSARPSVVQQGKQFIKQFNKLKRKGNSLRQEGELESAAGEYNRAVVLLKAVHDGFESVNYTPQKLTDSISATRHAHDKTRKQDAKDVLNHRQLSADQYTKQAEKALQNRDFEAAVTAYEEASELLREALDKIVAYNADRLSDNSPKLSTDTIEESLTDLDQKRTRVVEKTKERPIKKSTGNRKSVSVGTTVDTPDNHPDTTDLIIAIDELAYRLGRAPTVAEMDSQGRFSQRQYEDTFDSWASALQEAVIDVRAELISQLKHISNIVRRQPIKTDLDEHGKYDRHWYNDFFENWDDAVGAAGIGTPTKKELIDEIQRLDKRYRGVPTDKLMNNEGQYMSNQVRDQFQSWAEALTAAEIDKRERLESELIRIDSECNGQVTTTVADRISAHNSAYFLDEFGSWDKALQESGLDVSSSTNREKMSDTLQDLYDRLNRVPKTTELPEEHPPYEFYAEFGSWDEALEAAGIDKEQEIVDEISRVAEKLGHVPNSVDIEEHGEFPATNYIQYFDSLDEALLESGLDVSPNTNRGEMVNALQNLHDRLNRVPKTTELPEEHSPHDFYAEFGSWDEALETAGISKEQEIVDEISRVAEKIGHVPNSGDIQEYGEFPATNYMQYFDSLEEVLQRSGLDASPDLKREEMITTLQSLHERLDRVPKSTELPEEYSPREFYTEFGSWNEALETVGIDIKQGIIDEITRVAEKLGRIPNSTDIQKHGEYPVTNYSQHFNSLDDALQQCGLDVSSDANRKEMVNTLQSLHERLDRAPKPAELTDESDHSRNDFYTEFGSWDQALETAGIDKEQEIVDEISRVGKKIGRVPNTDDIAEHAEYPATSYSQCFNSLDEALQQTGLDLSSGTNCDEMINTLQELHERLGRVPKPTELTEESDYSPTDFYTEFGSWNEAMAAAGFDKEEEILEGINLLAEKLGRIPTSTDIHEHSEYPTTNYTSCFDSLEQTLQQSGLDVSSDRDRQDMLSTVNSLYERLERAPKASEIPEEYSQRDFYKEFGSWDEALETAGINIEQEISDEITRVANNLGRVPSTTDLQKHGEYPATNYQQYFDTWDDALQQSEVNQTQYKKDPRGQTGSSENGSESDVSQNGILDELKDEFGSLEHGSRNN